MANITRAVTGRCLWTTVLEYRHMDDVTGNLFFFALLSMAQGFENVCNIILDYFGCLAGAVCK